MTKKEVYALHGIEYKGGKIFSPLGWVPPLLRDGNSKLWRGVWTWSTLPGTALYDVVINGKSYTVRGTCCCDCVGCYAKTGFYRMRSVLLGLGRRTILARDYLEWLERALIAQIEADHIKILRVHCAGDFFSSEYVAMWRRVALACPDCVMWTYTKSRDYETAFDDVQNFNVVRSVLPGLGVNYGHCDYILSAFEALRDAGKRVHICRCGFDPFQHCINCRGCCDNDFVLFLEHSTSYKASDDPLFPVLCALVLGAAA